MSEQTANSATPSRPSFLPPGSLPAIVTVLAFVALQIAAAVNVSPFPDEAYYWTWSVNPAVAYFDHPPMVAWWIWIGTTLFGPSHLAMRSVFIAAEIADTVLLYVIGRLLFDHLAGLRAATWFFAAIMIGSLGMIATPDGPALFFWVLATLAFVLVVKTGRGEFWLAVGAAAGLGLLSKYHVFFFGFSVAFCLLAFRDLRHWFASGWLWAGGVLALAMFSPILVWNFQHDWASFDLQFGRVVDDFKLTPRNFVDYAFGLFLVLNPLLAIFVLRSAWVLGRRRAGAAGRGLGLLLLSALPLVGYMAVHAWHSRVDLHWLAPAFPALVLAAAAVATQFSFNRWWRVLRASVAPVGFVLSLLVILAIGGPLARLMPGIGGANFRGWPAYAAEIEAIRQLAGANWVAFDDYNLVAELSFQWRGRDIPVEQITQRIRYVFRPLPDAAIISTRGLVLLSPGRAELYAACLPGLTSLGEEASRKLDDGPRDVREAYIVERADPRVFAAGCDLPDRSAAP